MQSQYEVIKAMVFFLTSLTFTSTSCNTEHNRVDNAEPQNTVITNSVLEDGA